MGFRTIDINQSAEMHIKNGQLIIETQGGVASIPVEDLCLITAHGANIRLSTMDLSILAQNKVAIMTLDDRYLPTAIVLPFSGHVRQSQLMHMQVNTDINVYRNLWKQIIKRKIENQSRALSIMGRADAEKIAAYLEKLDDNNIDQTEALAAKEYFSLYHEGLNRRSEDPINSRLNYGYAVVRSAIARSLVSAGFHPTFGIHHDSQLNAFNLADDLIEPYRAMVDLIVHEHIGTSVRLSKAERYEIAHVLHNTCMMNGVKVNLLTAIDLMCESLKRIIMEKTNEPLLLPFVLPVESMEGITE